MTNCTPAHARALADMMRSAGPLTRTNVVDALLSLADQVDGLTAENANILRASLYSADLATQAMEDVKTLTAERDALKSVADTHPTKCASALAGWFVNDSPKVAGATPHWSQVSDEYAGDSDVVALSFAAPVVPVPVASAWMPIETAPKDSGSRLLLVNGYCVQGFVDATGVLHAQSEIPPHWRKLRGNPTHWMPMPPVPGAQDAPVARKVVADMLVNGGALQMVLNILRRGTPVQQEAAEELAKTAAPVAQLSEPPASAALMQILKIVQGYLPPNGTPINDAMSEIIACIDPWPGTGFTRFDDLLADAAEWSSYVEVDTAPYGLKMHLEEVFEKYGITAAAPTTPKD